MAEGTADEGLMVYKMNAQGQTVWVADAPAQQLEQYQAPAAERSAAGNSEKVGQKVVQQQKVAAAAKAAPAPIQPVARPAPVSTAQPVRAAAAPAQPNMQQMMASMPQAQPIQQVQMPDMKSTQVSMPALQTNSKADPNSEAFLRQLQQRTAQQQAGENAPVTASAERAIDLARRDIGDASAAQKKKKQEELLARGLSSGSGVGKGALRAVDEAARTRGARASSDIALGRERDQDALNLQRTAQTNALYGQLGQSSQVPFSQQLQGNQQALETWKANEAAQMGRAGLGVQAQSANAQIAAQQQAQQMAMWNALMGMAR